MLTKYALRIALLVAAVGFNSVVRAVNVRDPGVHSVIKAQIGDTWDRVVHNSTLKLKPLDNPLGTVINQPHTLVYRDPHHPMQFDNVGYTGVSLDYKSHRIQDFGIGPYRESSGVNETWGRLEDVIKKMEQAGWIPDEERNKRNRGAKSAEQLRAQYAELPGGAKGVERFWYDQYGNEAWVSLVKTITDGRAVDEPRFNVVLQIQVATHPKKFTSER